MKATNLKKEEVMNTMNIENYNSEKVYEKSYEGLKERTIDWLIFDITNKWCGCLRNDYTKHMNKCEAYALLFGEEEYGLIVEEAKRRIAELGLTEQEPKC